MNENEIQVWNYESSEIRTVQINGEPWFVLSDVCKVLELSSPHKVAERLDGDEKGRNQIPTLGGVQEMAVVNESGLYTVILRGNDFPLPVKHCAVRDSHLYSCLVGHEIHVI